jgi:hypothetical protein
LTRKIICMALAAALFLMSGCQRTTIITLPGHTAAESTSGTFTETTTGSTETTGSAPVFTTESTQTGTTETTEVTSSATLPPPTSVTETTNESTAPTQPDVYDISNHVIGTLELALFDAVNAQRETIAHLDETLCALAAIRSYEASIVYSSARPDGREGSSVLSDYGISATGAVIRVLKFTPDYTTAQIIRFLLRTEAGAEIFSSSYTCMGLGAYHWDGYVFLTFILAN